MPPAAPAAARSCRTLAITAAYSCGYVITARFISPCTLYHTFMPGRAVAARTRVTGSCGGVGQGQGLSGQAGRGA
jgi:hypothetical protein